MVSPKMGSWMVRSNKDPRWNKTGRSAGLVCTGGPQEMKDWIEHCRKEYGEPPDDAIQSFYKD